MTPPSEWTNAVKAAVIAMVNAAMGLGLAIAVIVGWDIDTQNYAILTVALETFINSAMALWILFTYRSSPSRATHEQLKRRGLTP